MRLTLKEAAERFMMEQYGIPQIYGIHKSRGAGIFKLASGVLK